MNIHKYITIPILLVGLNIAIIATFWFWARVNPFWAGETPVYLYENDKIWWPIEIPATGKVVKKNGNFLFIYYHSPIETPLSTRAVAEIEPECYNKTLKIGAILTSNFPISSYNYFNKIIWAHYWKDNKRVNCYLGKPLHEISKWDF